MSNNKMLIDATHPEETRVVVLRAGRVEEFDYESAARKLLRGNIYLAKVTRVEPSLQAAFVDYGGNRHGFLAFNEIHPDYYQIPTADRQALLDEEAAAEAEEEAAADARAEALARRRQQRDQGRDDRQGGREERHSRGEHGRGEHGRGDRRGRGPRRGGDRTSIPAGAEEQPAEAAYDDHHDHDHHDHDHDDHGHEPHTHDLPGHDLHDDHHRHGDHHGHEHVHGDAHPHDAEAPCEEEAPVTAPGAEQVHHHVAPAGEACVPDVAADEAGHHRDPAHDDIDDGDERDVRDGHRTVAEASGYHDDAHSEAPETVGGFEPVLEPDDEDDGEGDEAVETIDAASPSDTPKGRGLVEDEGVQEVNGNGATEAGEVDQVGSEDALEELPSRPRRRPRSYKIQEVIKRRQIILVQVVKEERGNKGAALTTYLSLAGRYTVLMPNTARGGGISRKITQPQDRKRLKAIAAELEVPEGMGLIIRTAGAARTKQEIRRDFEYLLRLWESVRELTLQSVAPSLVYEEGNLIKRSIRDLYNKDVEEIVVAGRTAHQEAHEFMSMLMPSHAKNVMEYREPEPLFTRYQIERQLNAMFSPYVTLRSGGYLVINQTEALVAIDVNSGKATREFSIEETALNTNLEAAEEIARQLKLRDLAGLIVIDFIDMEERRNNRKVETRLKDSLRFDRARIQVGRISHFGLMEMSRQRLRTGVLEGSTSQCPHCQGTGIIRSTESVALAVLRGLEDAIMGGARTSLIATTTPTVALYILNNKRPFIIDMERRTGLPIVVNGSDKMQGANFTIEKGAAPVQPLRRPERTAVKMEWGFEGEVEEEYEPEGPETEVETEADGFEAERVEETRADAAGSQGEEGRRRRRRRRRGRRGDRPELGGELGDDAARDMRLPDNDVGPDYEASAEDDDGAETDDAAAACADETGDADAAGNGDGDRPRRGRRRGRRGGRRGRDRERGGQPGDGDAPEVEAAEAQVSAPEGDAGEAGDDASLPAVAQEIGAQSEAVEVEERATHDADAPRSEQPVSADPVDAAEATVSAEAPERAPEIKAVSEPVAKPRREQARAEVAPPPADAIATPEAVEPAAAAEPTPEPVEAAAPKRRSRGAPVASEPKVERVVVRPDQPDAPQELPVDAAPADKPARRGWWNRRG